MALPFSAADAAPCRMIEPDLSVYGVRIGDAVSAAKRVGSAPPLEERNEDLPAARFVSRDGSQQLVLFSHGGGADEYGEFEVRYAGSEAIALKELNTNLFSTESGITLGMSPELILRRFGTCTKSRDRDGDFETIQYELAGVDQDPILAPFGYTTYFAEYEFQRGKLIRYRFGFEYP